MKEKIIRSHRERVKQANHLLKTNPMYSHVHISVIDKEAFVEFFLLEDIVKLYNMRLKEEKECVIQGQAEEKEKKQNIEDFTAIINAFNAAIAAARSAINSGDYKKVWKAIHEHALMAAAKSVKDLPKLRELAIDLLCELSSDMTIALD